jgi:polysaccharide pyruvyl transferase WcaK-like protein
MTHDLLRHISPKINPVISPDPAYSIFSHAEANTSESDSAAKPLCLFNLEPTSFSLNLASILEDSYRLVSTNRRAMIPKMSASFLGPREHMKVIEKADLIVTMSFHETMAAAALGTPYIAVERCVTSGRSFGTTKLSDLCKRLESPDRYIDPEDTKFSDPNLLKSAISRALLLPDDERIKNQNICRTLSRDFHKVCNKIITDSQAKH